jgi:YD repeat-containing protein
MGDLLKYSGIRRDGVSVGGSTGRSSASELTRRLFDRRLRSATVTDASGAVVGEIGPHPDTGRRTWWAYDAPGRMTMLQGGAAS